MPVPEVRPDPFQPRIRRDPSLNLQQNPLVHATSHVPRDPQRPHQILHPIPHPPNQSPPNQHPPAPHLPRPRLPLPIPPRPPPRPLRIRPPILQLRIGNLHRPDPSTQKIVKPRPQQRYLQILRQGLFPYKIFCLYEKFL